MSIRALVQAESEDIQSLELAAERGLFDGLELLLQERTWGGIYLLGYVAEIVLKTAFCRLNGGGIGSIVPDYFGPARVLARSQGIPTAEMDGYHSLWWWARLVMRRRLELGLDDLDLTPEPLSMRVQRLHEHWLVEMRYHNQQITQADGQRVYDDVIWLWDHRVRLWS